MRRLILLLFVLISVGASAQEVARSAVTSGGHELAAGGYSLSGSFGQFVIYTYDSGTATLTQGFQQIDINPCFGDLNNDGYVNTGDLVILLGNFGCTGDCIGDITNDAVVNTADLVALLAVFGTICP